ncbi:hypothetical protein E3C22_16545 [Jiella endophytica]|uniref:Uncharacterized protein n=1 Tax=Jiella endophytica TaxID=2558362 RepID=A0A4Y8RFA6_9HYPH|nr:hypothetical protein [Jiella endophytica]TFF20518.1 hypothetical protein E3C22_16545 [Jiella endophytica]
MTALLEARIIAEVPLAKGGGTRAIAVDNNCVCHVFTVSGGMERLAPQQSFTPETAREIARRVLAGDERIQTAHNTLRILAAAVLTDGVTG